MALIGILSDTHDQINNLDWAIKYLKNKDIDLLIHCGDWVSPFSLVYYKPISVQIIGVYGNNDGDIYRHILYGKKQGLNIEIYPNFHSFEFANRKIAIYHGEYPEIVTALEKSDQFDVLFHGHNHKPSIYCVNNTLSFNPGTLMDYTDNKIKGATFGLYNSNENDGKLVRIGEK